MGHRAHGKISGQRLVVFGCGYVGSALAARALAEGAQVTAITRNVTTASALRASGVDTIVADVAGNDWTDALPRAPEFVVNCVSSGGGGVEGYRQSYLRGMESIVSWARRDGGVGTIVYTSSTSVYAQGGGTTIDETAAVGGGSETAEILVQAEQVLMDALDVGKRRFILRLAGIYGPGRHSLLEQIRTGAVAGSGEHHLNLAHRDDIVSAILSCLAPPAAGPDGIFNVADDWPTRKAEVVQWLANRLGLPVPPFTGAPAGNRRSVTPDRRIQNGRLKHALGWQPQYPSFREGYAAILGAGT